MELQLVPLKFPKAGKFSPSAVKASKHRAFIILLSVWSGIHCYQKAAHQE
jgi:hypothetical protein